MKKLLVVFLILIAGIAAGAGFLILKVYDKTAPMVATAETFFAALATDDAPSAYRLGSEAFREATDAEALGAYAGRYGLAGNGGITVGNREFTDDSNGPDRGQLSGAIALADGGTTDFTMMLVHDRGADLWRVRGLVLGSREPAVPAPGALAELLSASNRLLARALAANDIAVFRGATSRFWQNRMDLAAFEADYRGAMQYADALTQVFAQQPEIAAGAAVSDSGILNVRATYPAGTDIVITEHRYVIEGIGWRLLGLYIKLEPAS